MRTTAMKMAHDTDPKKKIIEAVGDLSKFKLFSNQILLGLYQRPQMTASGIHLADITRDEDKYQGKVGLVLMKGPLAFVDDETTQFHGQDVEIGDWVAAWVSDGRSISINGQLCRVIRDTEIRMTIPAPDVVY